MKNIFKDFLTTYKKGGDYDIILKHLNYIIYQAAFFPIKFSISRAVEIKGWGCVCVGVDVPL